MSLKAAALIAIIGMTLDAFFNVWLFFKGSFGPEELPLLKLTQVLKILAGNGTLILFFIVLSRNVKSKPQAP